ncbi:MAG: hypothetical protein EA382_17615 [Spirochaetaceae bacterium]|nr:MAG: hypothetical protein EA382_17615 [Spirochaetaceae bacterium]
MSKRRLPVVPGYRVADVDRRVTVDERDLLLHRADRMLRVDTQRHRHDATVGHDAHRRPLFGRAFAVRRQRLCVRAERETEEVTTQRSQDRHVDRGPLGLPGADVIRLNRGIAPGEEGHRRHVPAEPRHSDRHVGAVDDEGILPMDAYAFHAPSAGARPRTAVGCRRPTVILNPVRRGSKTKRPVAAMVEAEATMAKTGATLRADLSEREKELDALYRLSALFSRADVDAPAAIATTESILGASMRSPDAALVTIDAPAIASPEGTPGSSAVADLYRCRRTYGDGRRLTVTVRYIGDPSRAELRIESREKRLVAATASLLADLLERRDTDAELRASSAALERQAAELERKNVALEEVLARIEADKRALSTRQRAYLDTYVRPYLLEIADACRDVPSVGERIAQIDAALSRLFTHPDDRLTLIARLLTPRESEVCGLIRSGMATKEIADFLGIGATTVERHRNTIRRKLGLTGSRTNLTSFLRQATADLDHV